MSDENEKKNKIVICLGSSCFSRGNNKNVEVINEFMRDNKSSIEIDFTGTLCEDKCNKGPNILINNKLYNAVDPNSLVELLNHVLVK